MDIRVATSFDTDAIRGVYLSAFPLGEREFVSELAIKMLSEETSSQTNSLVAETEGAVIGHVAFSPVIMDNKGKLQGYILSPLGVHPDYQKRGIGSKLIKSGMQQLSTMGVNILFVYGDPQFYNRFGFSADAAVPYTPPFQLQYPFGWQAIVLHECSIENSPIRLACVSSLCDPRLWEAP